jgi:hypothetical protein
MYICMCYVQCASRMKKLFFPNTAVLDLSFDRLFSARKKFNFQILVLNLHFMRLIYVG